MGELRSILRVRLRGDGVAQISVVADVGVSGLSADEAAHFQHGECGEDSG